MCQQSLILCTTVWKWVTNTKEGSVRHGTTAWIHNHWSKRLLTFKYRLWQNKKENDKNERKLWQWNHAVYRKRIRMEVTLDVPGKWLIKMHSHLNMTYFHQPSLMLFHTVAEQVSSYIFILFTAIAVFFFFFAPPLRIWSAGKHC